MRQAILHSSPRGDRERTDRVAAFSALGYVGVCLAYFSFASRNEGNAIYGGVTSVGSHAALETVKARVSRTFLKLPLRGGFRAIAYFPIAILRFSFSPFFFSIQPSRTRQRNSNVGL